VKLDVISIYDGFQHAECYLPGYPWDAVEGFTQEEIKYFEEYIRSFAYMIISLEVEG
jgi:hypothetical protein